MRRFLRLRLERSVRYREVDREAAALDRDPALVALGDGLDDGEAESRSRRRGALAAPEALECVLGHFGGQAGALVGDADPRAALRLLHGDVDPALFVPPGV